MKHISLFSGIGGFDLAAEWMGWENVAHCEWNPFGQKILKYYWPNAISYDDITKTNFSIHRGTIDILTGGFPCQPYSVAGKRKGKEDERHLWPEMLRAIREIAPRWVVGENVRGIINWNGGLVFDEVQADLEAEGYEILPFLLPAAGVNAPHERYRTWFVAYNNNSGTINNGRINPNREKKNERRKEQPQPEYCQNGGNGFVENANQNGRGSELRKKEPRKRKQRHTGSGVNERVPSNNAEAGNATNANGRRLPVKKHRQEKTRRFTEKSIRDDWQNFPTQSPVCNGDDGLSAGLDIETILKSVGRKVNKLFKPWNWWRNESIKAGGNAIVPQEVYQIFKAIEQYEKHYRKHQSL